MDSIPSAPTNGSNQGDKFTPPGRQTTLVELIPHARCAKSIKNTYECHDNIAQALNMLDLTSKRATF